ncbi:uncharacterized protein LOC116849051 isoform X1 [Odontomachus brunneus]|uniref:uncharacterized protein LOC116849051 isoform X1 n=1 Tax=Odontomachus brunneus TaxID=486640 RepID=UPI0013F1A4F5|nr:uncharacterized protein LOC116849051 isoform X1 [Odontomachus brunneus]
MKRRMTWFPRSSRRLSDLWQLTLWRKLGALEKSKDCPSSPTVEDAPETRSSASSYHPSTDDGPSEDPCSLSPSPEKQDPPPCPCPKPPTCHPDSDPRRLVLWRTLSLVVALPLVVIMSAYTYARQLERAKEPRPPFLNLPYMYRRTKVRCYLSELSEQRRDLRALYSLVTSVASLRIHTGRILRQKSLQNFLTDRWIDISQ